MMTRCLVFLVLLVGSTSAQVIHPSPPIALPTVLEAHFGSYGPYSAAFYLPVPQPLVDVIGKVTFENIDEVGKSVVVEWQTRYEGRAVAYRTDEFGCSFRPTAVCAKAGTTDTLFVAGWVERLGVAVVEEWRFDDFAVAVAVSESGATTAALSAVRVIRSALLLCPDMQPISSLAVNYHGNELWILDEPMWAPRSVSVLDLDDEDGCAAVSPLVVVGVSMNTANHPELASYGMMRAQQHPDVGFVIFIESRRAWESGFDYFEPYPMLQVADLNKDGLMDAVSIPTYTSVYQQHPAAGWTWDYQ